MTARPPGLAYNMLLSQLIRDIKTLSYGVDGIEKTSQNAISVARDTSGQSEIRYEHAGQNPGPAEVNGKKLSLFHWLGFHPYFLTDWL